MDVIPMTLFEERDVTVCLQVGRACPASVGLVSSLANNELSAKKPGNER